MWERFIFPPRYSPGTYVDLGAPSVVRCRRTDSNKVLIRLEQFSKYFVIVPGVWKSPEISTRQIFGSRRIF